MERQLFNPKDWLKPLPMEMIGYWTAPWQYRIKHPTTGRTQDIVFDGTKDGEAMETIIRHQKRRAAVDLLGPPEKPKVSRRYRTDRSAFAINEFEQWKYKPWDFPTTTKSMVEWEPNTRGMSER